MFAIIQSLIDQEAKLAMPAADLTPRANLYDLGLTSFDAIRLLVTVVACEFQLEFLRETLTRPHQPTDYGAASVPASA